MVDYNSGGAISVHWEHEHLPARMFGLYAQGVGVIPRADRLNPWMGADERRASSWMFMRVAPFFIMILSAGREPTVWHLTE